MIGEDLITFLNDDVDVTDLVDSRISQGAVNESDTCPRVWVGRASREDELDCGAVGGMVVENFDIECVSIHSSTNDGVSESLGVADAIRDAMHGHKGDFGSTTVSGVFVDDQNDDYIPKAIDSPDGYYVTALSVRIFC